MFDEILGIIRRDKEIIITTDCGNETFTKEMIMKLNPVFFWASKKASDVVGIEEITNELHLMKENFCLKEVMRYAKFFCFIQKLSWDKKGEYVPCIDCLFKNIDPITTTIMGRAIVDWLRVIYPISQLAQDSMAYARMRDQFLNEREEEWQEEAIEIKIECEDDAEEEEEEKRS